MVLLELIPDSKTLFIEAVLEPWVQQSHTKQHYEGQDLIKARLASKLISIKRVFTTFIIW